MNAKWLQDLHILIAISEERVNKHSNCQMQLLYLGYDIMGNINYYTLFFWWRNMGFYFKCNRMYLFCIFHSRIVLRLHTLYFEKVYS